MTTHKTLAAKIDQLFAEWNRSDSPGAAVAVIRDGEVIYKHGYGMANLEYDIPITPTTIFDIASVSKQFAAFAIVTLSHQGKLSIDDDIRTHLPDLPNFGNTITIRHLLHHTSGLRDWVQSLSIAGDLMDDIISFKHILKMARHQKAFNFAISSFGI
ncbi:MAG: serine hydrolase [Candidatus Poribacteria bacterium]|nr:serine hydrolase [Candidatus Poribacteria bacterium]